MRSPHTLTAQTRRRILAVYAAALIAWSHGEPIHTAAVDGEIDDILVDAFVKAGACAVHKARLEIRPQDD